MFSGMRSKKPQPDPGKSDWPSGELMTKEKFVQTAYAVIKETMGVREKIIAEKEAKIGDMERICRTCLSALQDTNPNLAEMLWREFEEFYK